jgi:DHA2 family multidrug resistance protein
VVANSQVLKNVTRNLGYFAERHAGSPKTKAEKQSGMIIASHLRNQAYIQGIDDDFLIAAVITLIGGIPVLFLHTKKKRNNLNSNKSSLVNE